MELNKLLEKITADFAKRPEILFAYLYGSYAKGTATPQSDVDICLVLDDKNLPSDLYRYMFQIQEELTKLAQGRKVEAIPRHTMSYPLYYTAVLQGRPIYAKNEPDRVSFELNAINNFENIKPFYDSVFEDNMAGVTRRLDARQTGNPK